MPRMQRRPVEIEGVRENILEQAIAVIVEFGYVGFTMRRLASRLGVTATTIYNYYKSKDELYIAILNRGFETLLAEVELVNQRRRAPLKKFRAMIGAYTDFGLENPHLYNLMYSWHVPKYNDYVGTPLEPTARVHLETATKLHNLFIDTLMECATAGGRLLSRKEATFYIIHYWSQIHGYVAGCNNSALSYVHRDPPSLKDTHLDLLMEKLTLDLKKKTKKGPKVL
jgi:AcrR family transcriptional regulator